MQQLAAHELLDESYWGDGIGARWIVGQRGTFVGKCEIIAGIGGSLIVHGDYDLCRFACYGDRADAWARLRWMADCTDVSYYVAQKASIGLRNQDVVEYDEDVAVAGLRERLADERQEHDVDQEMLEFLEGALAHTENQHELRRYLAEEGSRWDAWEWDVGKVLSYRVVVSHVALNRCAWLLRARYGYAGPPACRRKEAA